MNNLTKNLGIKIKELRKGKKLTQEELAQDIGIQTRQLARIEAGKSFMSAETIYKLCVTLDIQPAELFDFRLDEVIENRPQNSDALLNDFIDTACEVLKQKGNTKKFKDLLFGK